jgi:hypothetical protein
MLKERDVRETNLVHQTITGVRTKLDDLVDLFRVRWRAMAGPLPLPKEKPKSDSPGSPGTGGGGSTGDTGGEQKEKTK